MVCSLSFTYCFQRNLNIPGHTYENWDKTIINSLKNDPKASAESKWKDVQNYSLYENDDIVKQLSSITLPDANQILRRSEIDQSARSVNHTRKNNQKQYDMNAALKFSSQMMAQKIPASFSVFII